MRITLASIGDAVITTDASGNVVLLKAVAQDLTGWTQQRAHRAAAGGLDALDIAAAFRPDVVLLDIGMPRLNGYDAARRFRDQPWGRDLWPWSSC